MCIFLVRLSADKASRARTALFAAQRNATPEPVTSLASAPVQVDAAALTTAAQKLLPELGVSVDLLPAEEIEYVVRLSRSSHLKCGTRTDPLSVVLRRIATLQGAEYAPSCAIVGGILGQDVLNAIGGKEEPVRNFFVFEGATGQGRVWPLGV